MFNAQGKHTKKKRNNKGKKPGNGDQKKTHTEKKNTKLMQKLHVRRQPARKAAKEQDQHRTKTSGPAHQEQLAA